MFEKMLIANRGEIAVRVMRACRELGIATVAIFSEADRASLHVRLADEAYPCGPAPPRDSYLVAERVVEIARRAGANAIHPGYGFLAENGNFADLCAASGIAFVGPDGDVIRSMGDKVTARNAMREAGIAVVPGMTQPLTDADAQKWAEHTGYPLVVKAAAGGGGKGMRLVALPAQLGQALERVRGEARSAFGDDTLYLEKWITSPRHIEVQFLVDAHGNAIDLGERECSIQRRHQKLIEEAPANRVGDDLRAALGRAALTAAVAVGYRGAGICEFLVDENDAFYFLEMNTRIQVEHPVTEAVTGVDLVVEMIRIAAGEPLPIAQSDIEIRGHAIEARIYAEDPDRGFVPSPGQIAFYRPPGGFGVRVDSGVQSGAQVTTHYDPLIAKLIAWGSDRDTAISRLDRALAEFAVQGIKTSIPFHRRALRHPVFRSGRYTTDFIDRHLGGGKGGEPSGADRAARASEVTEPAASARRIAIRLAAIAAFRAARGEDGIAIDFAISEKNAEDAAVAVREVSAGRYEVTAAGRTESVDATAENGTYSVIEAGRQLEAIVAVRGSRFDVAVDGYSHRLEVIPGGGSDE